MKKRLLQYVKFSFFIYLMAVMVACKRGKNDPGTQYAPNMYRSIPYEGMTQVKENPINPLGLNMRKPVEGTIAQKNYKYQNEEGNWEKVELLVYNIHPDSLEQSATLLSNPLPKSDQIIEEGRTLYSRFCQHCHGVNGDGDGAVAAMYKGVAKLNAGAIAQANDGHVFHVITHGKGRMWPHASQISPLERWKIVHYVHQLQGKYETEKEEN